MTIDWTKISRFAVPEKSAGYLLWQVTHSWQRQVEAALLVWHSCKEFITHQLFESVNKLQEILNRLLNQGELIINWSRNIQNKGNKAIVN